MKTLDDITGFYFGNGGWQDSHEVSEVLHDYMTDGAELSQDDELTVVVTSDDQYIGYQANASDFAKNQIEYLRSHVKGSYLVVVKRSELHAFYGNMLQLI